MFFFCCILLQKNRINIFNNFTQRHKQLIKNQLAKLITFN